VSIFRLSLPFEGSADSHASFSELHARVQDAVRTAVDAVSLEADSRWFLDAVTAEAEAMTNLHEYATKGRLNHLVFDEVRWREKIEPWFKTRHVEALTAIRAAYEVRSPPSLSLSILNCCRVVPPRRRPRDTSERMENVNNPCRAALLECESLSCAVRAHARP
jgi:hypothetical protein